MKVVIQRVKKAKVIEVKTGKVSGSIANGFLVLLGIGKKDSEETVEILTKKLANLRVFSDSKGLMNLSLKDTGDSVLLVSQFTLYGNIKKGNRPSFIEAEEPKKAKERYNYFRKCLQNENIKVETGVFGSEMEIEATLDGPTTILMEK